MIGQLIALDPSAVPRRGDPQQTLAAPRENSEVDAAAAAVVVQRKQWRRVQGR